MVRFKALRNLLFSLWDSVVDGVVDMGAHKSRSVLQMVGIILGVGSVAEGVLIVATAFAGMVAFSAALVGFFHKRTTLWERGLLLLAAFAATRKASASPTRQR